MKLRYLFIFSILVALLSMVSSLLPASAQAITISITTTPTRKPSSRVVNFDLKRVNQVPPSDILRQITFASQGGGVLCEATSYPSPAIGKTSEPSQELMVYSFMGVCGWAKNEKLTGSVKFPNGHIQPIIVKTELADGLYTGVISFRPGVDDPIGKYTLTMSGKSKSLQMVVNYTVPRGPHVYTLDTNHVLLYGFAPSEGIKLFFYSGANGAFKGWQEYTTGTDGRLEIKTSMKLVKGDFFVAIGKKTGEVQMLFDGFYGGMGDWVREKTITLNANLLCQNGLPSRVKVGDQARAAFTDGSKLRIRDKSGFSNVASHSIPEGTKMKIVGGPKCADNSTWWKVEVSADVKGWVAEYWHGDEYLIEPLP